MWDVIDFYDSLTKLPLKLVRRWVNELNITFIFDRCRHSSTVVTRVKYECGLKKLRGTFARSKIFAYGEINAQGFSNNRLRS